MEVVKDGELEIVIYLLSGTLTFLIMSTLLIIVVSRNRKRKLEEALRQEQLIADHKDELLKNQLYTQDKERRRISQDIHDEIGAMASLLKMKLLQESGELSIRKGNSQAMREYVKLTDQLLVSSKRISYELMPPTLTTLGLVSTIECHLDTVRDRMDVQFEYEEDPKVDETTAVMLYRIILEVLNNTLKHAHADKIWLSFDSRVEAFRIDYRDNGIGLDVSKGKGLGLEGIRTRVAFLKGEVDFFANESGGMRMVIDIPKSLTSNASDHACQSRNR